MSEKIFDIVESILRIEIDKRVHKELQSEFKKYNINLTSNGELIISDEYNVPVPKDKLQSMFDFKVSSEKNKIVSDILGKLGFPIKE